MKTLARILLILTVFALAAGVLYTAVTLATGSSAATTSPQFERPLPDGEQRPGNEGDVSGEWIFETAKNLIVMGGLVALVNAVREPYQRKRLLEVLRLR